MYLVSLITTTLLSGTPTTARQPEPTLIAPDSYPTFADWQVGSAHSARPNGLYLRLTGGLVTTQNSNGPSNQDIDFDQGYLFSVGLGDRIGALENGLGFSLELDGIWTDEKANDNGTTQPVRRLGVEGALLDGIFDVRIADRFSIYAGAGVGAAWLDVSTTDSDAFHDFHPDSGLFLAWTAKAGVMWRFAESTALHFGYRFLNIDNAQIDDSIANSSFDLKTQQHVIEAGLIFGV